jgi:uncharacterized protein (TIGR03067 family)
MTTDLDKLQGTWRVTSLETDGEKSEAAAFDAARIEITGNRFVSVGMGATYEGTIELHARRASGKPKAFDLLFTSGPPEGERNPGIYELDGDRWTICLSTRGGKRPRSLATKPGTGCALEVLERDDGKRSAKRQKSASKGAPASSTMRSAPAIVVTGTGPATELEGDWQMLSGVFNGKPLDQSMVAWCTRVTRGDVTAVIAGPQTMLKARFTLDPSRRPATIDYVNLEGPNRGKSQKGIYELENGTLKVCMAVPGGPRPTAFDSTKGDGRSLTTWRRAPDPG